MKIFLRQILKTSGLNYKSYRKQTSKLKNLYKKS